MRRFKTKQEFAREGGPDNWSENMDVFFGLPQEKTGHFSLYPELESSSWTVQDIHLTNEPHPYHDVKVCVYVVNEDESALVQKKAFHMGYRWSSQGQTVSHTEYRYLYFDTDGCITHSAFKRKNYLTYQQFMDGDTLSSFASGGLVTSVGCGSVSYHSELGEATIRKRRKLQTSLRVEDHVHFDVKGEHITYRVSGSEQYHLSCMTNDNERIFQVLNLDKVNFTKDVLGYYLDGRFPYTKSLEDLHRLMEALHQEIAQQVAQQASHEVIVKGEDLAAALASTTQYIREKLILHTSKTSKNGKIIKVSRTAPAIRSGESPGGRAISGRTSKTSVRRGSVSYQAVLSGL